MPRDNHDRVLSIDEIRRWLRRVSKEGNNFAMREFCRAMKMSHGQLKALTDGTETLRAPKQRLMSRFIRDYENGLVEFGSFQNSHYGGSKKRVVIHRIEAKPMPTILKVDFTQGAKLQFMPRPMKNPEMPTIRGMFDKKPS